MWIGFVSSSFFLLFVWCGERAGCVSRLCVIPSAHDIHRCGVIANNNDNQFNNIDNGIDFVRILSVSLYIVMMAGN